MKKILLLGDSIRIGYDKSIRLSLEGMAEVVFPEENCRFASYLLRYFHEYLNTLAHGRADIICWNAGLWDCLRLFEEEPHTPVEHYAFMIERICRRIKKLCPDAHVIFSTSTTVQSEKMDKDFKRYNEEIAQYNAAALAVVRQYGFEVCDLYAVSQALPASAHSDPVHYYTPEGTRAFTRALLSHLAPLLGAVGEIPYREVVHVKKPVGI